MCSGQTVLAPRKHNKSAAQIERDLHHEDAIVRDDELRLTRESTTFAAPFEAARPRSVSVIAVRSSSE